MLRIKLEALSDQRLMVFMGREPSVRKERKQAGGIQAETKHSTLIH